MLVYCEILVNLVEIQSIVRECLTVLEILAIRTCSLAVRQPLGNAERREAD